MTPRDRLMSIAARMVRLGGGCEKGHRPGRWHMHEEEFLALGREMAALYHATTPAPLALDAPVVTLCARRDCRWQITGPHTPHGPDDFGRPVHGLMDIPWATPTTLALDVERLARAMHNLHNEGSPDDWKHNAQFIAAEYNRLAPQAPDETHL